MIDKPLAGRKIAIVLANGFEEEEFTEPQKKLIEAGATTKVVSRANGLVNGWYEGGWGHFFPVDQDLAETLAIDYDALVVPGGSRAVEKLADDPHAMRVLKAFVRAAAPTFIVGDAVRLLAVGEVVSGRAVTGSDDVRAEVEAAGANWTEAAANADGNLVTASGVDGVRETVGTFIEKVAAYESEDAQAA